MKIKTLLIPAIGLSIAGVLAFKQGEIDQFTASPEVITTTKAPHSPIQINEMTENATESENVTVAEVQALPDEIIVEHIQTEPNAYDHLKEGEKLSLFIPQEQHDYIGTVEKSYQQFGGQIKVSTGSLDSNQQLSSFTVTKGPELTLIMVATGDSIYQIEIDNKTGAGTVIDDQALDYFRKDDDAISTPPEGIS